MLNVFFDLIEKLFKTRKNAGKRSGAWPTLLRPSSPGDSFARSEEWSRFLAEVKYSFSELETELGEQTEELERLLQVVQRNKRLSDQVASLQEQDNKPLRTLQDNMERRLRLESSEDNRKERNRLKSIAVGLAAANLVLGALLGIYFSHISSWLKSIMGLGLLTSLLLAGCMVGLIYVLLKSRSKNWSFGITSGRMLRQSVVLESYESPISDMLCCVRRVPLVSHYIALPRESRAESRLPWRIYQGEGEVIVIRPFLDRVDENDTLVLAELSSQVSSDNAKRLSASRTRLESYATLALTRRSIGNIPHDKSGKYLSAEIIAAGFLVDGEKKQRQEMSVISSGATFTWGISAEQSGNHELALVFSLENDKGEEIAKIGTIFHKIKVVSILGLNHRQVTVLKWVLGSITTLLAVLKGLQLLDVI